MNSDRRTQAERLLLSNIIRRISASVGRYSQMPIEKRQEFEKKLQYLNTMRIRIDRVLFYQKLISQPINPYKE